MKLSVSILGIGSMGLNHLRILSEMKNIRINYIYDQNITKLKEYANFYKVKFTKNLNEIRKSSDCVIIATTTTSHYKFIKYFLKKSQIKIFVEKPLVTNLKQAMSLKKIINTKNIQCGFIERYNEATSVLKKIISEKDAISLDFIRTDKVSSRVKDIDVIYDLMIHDIDLSVLLNGKIKKIFASGYKQNGQIVYATAILIHNNNKISRLLASRITQKKIRQISLTTKNSYLIANLLNSEITINTQTNLRRNDNKKIQSKNEYTIFAREEKILTKYSEPLKNELNDFMRFSRNLTNKIPNFDESLYNMAICEKIKNEIKKNLPKKNSK